jgi:hypothetical protein
VPLVTLNTKHFQDYAEHEGLGRDSRPAGSLEAVALTRR